MGAAEPLKLGVRGGERLLVVFVRGLRSGELWSVYGIVLLALGVRQGIAALRWQALVLFGVTTMKVFFVDLGSLSGFYRIASSLALGVVLLVVSFLYQRRISASAPEQSS